MYGATHVLLTRKKPVLEIYPTISVEISAQPIIAFDKIDGSNIRVEWTRKGGFAKFGARRRLLDVNEEPLGEAIPLFMDSYSEDLERIFRKERYEKVTAFFEFAGANSFAGKHEDEEHIVTLFDVQVFKKGMMLPREFVKTFGDTVRIPTILYEGNANVPFVESVRDGSLEGMTFEGVVCKGALDKRNRPVRFKVKNQAWLDRLKEKYGHDPALYESLK